VWDTETSFRNAPSKVAYSSRSFLAEGSERCERRVPSLALPPKLVVVYYGYGGKNKVRSYIDETCEPIRNHVDKIGEYLMIETLHVENFRSFKSLDLSKLRRINILVGQNASGKTVLLEAIKVGLDGLPGVLSFLNQLRGNTTFVAPNSTAEQFQAQFIDYFYSFNTRVPILVSFKDSTGREASVKIQFDPKRAVTTQPPLGFQIAPATSPTTVVPLAFERTNFLGVKDTLLATLTPQGQFIAEPGPPLGLISGFFSNAYFGVPSENAGWLSKLSIENRSQEVIESLQRHFKFIKQVTSEIVPPGFAAVFAMVEGLERKIPLSLVSGGISRLFTLMLAIVAYTNGVVIIDEIENGIFHQQYALVWRSMLDLSRHHGTQLFVSAHSRECLKEAISVIQESPDEFSLLRVKRHGSNSSVEQFEGEQLEKALEKNGEVRD